MFGVTGLVTEGSGVQTHAEAKDFPLLKKYRRALRPTQLPIQRVSDYFLGGMLLGSKAAQSHLSTVKNTNEWSCTSTSPLHLHGGDRTNLAFSLCMSI